MAANTVAITVKSGFNIAEKRGPLREKHHAWRKNNSAEPITPYVYKHYFIN